MTIDQLIKLLAAITLVEMMIGIGLGVTLSDVLLVGKDWQLIARALLANYALVPAAAVCLLVWFHVDPMVAAGFLLAAVCPGAPYSPSFTAIAKGDVNRTVGLMVILAGSSAVIAPLLLGLLLPIVAGDRPLEIDVSKMVPTLLGVQLLPLGFALWVRGRHPSLADSLLQPARALSLVLNLLLLGVIVSAQFRMLSDIHLKGCVEMLCLLVASMAAGWSVSRQGDSAKAMVITTSVRNVGVTLVLATASFAGTAAITSATAYGLFQTFAVACVALAWGRSLPGMILVKNKRPEQQESYAGDAFGRKWKSR
jgi:BASS family bile acid:Na+ symporter